MSAEVVLSTQVTHGGFGLLPVESMPDGKRAIRFGTRQGELHVWPLSAEQARDLAQQLTGVEIAGAEDMPGRNGMGS